MYFDRSLTLGPVTVSMYHLLSRREKKAKHDRLIKPFCEWASRSGERYSWWIDPGKKTRKRKLSSIASNMTSLTSTNKQTFLLVLLSVSVTGYNVGIWFIDTVGT